MLFCGCALFHSRLAKTIKQKEGKKKKYNIYNIVLFKYLYLFVLLIFYIYATHYQIIHWLIEIVKCQFDGLHVFDILFVVIVLKHRLYPHVSFFFFFFTFTCLFMHILL